MTAERDELAEALADEMRDRFGGNDGRRIADAIVDFVDARIAASKASEPAPAAHPLSECETPGCPNPAPDHVAGRHYCAECTAILFPTAAKVEAAGTPPECHRADGRSLLRLPNPTADMLDRDKLFDAIYDTIKSWDVNVPAYYVGHFGANGSHATLIYEAVRPLIVVAAREAAYMKNSRDRWESLADEFRVQLAASTAQRDAALARVAALEALLAQSARIAKLEGREAAELRESTRLAVLHRDSAIASRDEWSRLADGLSESLTASNAKLDAALARVAELEAELRTSERVNYIKGARWAADSSAMQAEIDAIEATWTREMTAPPAAVQAEAGKVEPETCPRLFRDVDGSLHRCVRPGGHLAQVDSPGGHHETTDSKGRRTKWWSDGHGDAGDAPPDLSAPGAAEVYGQSTAFAGSKIGGGKAGLT